MSSIYVGDIGTEIIVDCGSDIAGATTHELQVRKGDGTIVTWDATVDGQSLKYITKNGDINVHGTYILQANVAVDGWSGLGSMATFNVLKQWK